MFLAYFPFLLVVVHPCVAIEIKFAKLIYFISLASVQIYIYMVPLCDYKSNVRKQAYMALEAGPFNT